MQHLLITCSGLLVNTLSRIFMINEQTLVYASFTSRPGSFGATVFNQLFLNYQLNALYLPRRGEDGSVVARLIREFDIRGAAVSAPLKQTIMSHLDTIDATAAKIGSVNTVLNRDG